MHTGHTPPHTCKMDPNFHDGEQVQVASCEIQYKTLNQSLKNFSCQHGWDFYNYSGSTIVTEVRKLVSELDIN